MIGRNHIILHTRELYTCFNYFSSTYLHVLYTYIHIFSGLSDANDTGTNIIAQNGFSHCHNFNHMSDINSIAK